MIRTGFALAMPRRRGLALPRRASFLQIETSVALLPQLSLLNLRRGSCRWEMFQESGNRGKITRAGKADNWKLCWGVCHTDYCEVSHTTQLIRLGFPSHSFILHLSLRIFDFTIFHLSFSLLHFPTPLSSLFPSFAPESALPLRQTLRECH